MSNLVNTPAYFSNKIVSFIAANSTYGKVLCDIGAAAAAATATQFALQGGQRVFDLTATSTDATANSVLVYEALQMTLYASMGVATTTATSNATITRTAGSFIADGWVVGDNAMQVGAITAGNNCNPGTVTAVVALTLTFNGVPTGWAAETQGAGFRVLKVHRKSTIPLAASAGTGTTANVQLLNSTYDKTTDLGGIELDPLGMLVVAMNAAVSALPAFVSIQAKTAQR